MLGVLGYLLYTAYAFGHPSLSNRDVRQNVTEVAVEGYSGTLNDESSNVADEKIQVVFLTAANAAYEGPRKLAVAAARTCELFDRIMEHDEATVRDLPFYSTHMLPLLQARNRGWGYWSFKPITALHAFSSMRDGDILVYHDAGARVDCRSAARRAQLRAWVSLLDPAGGKDALAFQMRYLECNWHKADSLAHLGVLHDSAIIETGQLHATFWMLRKTPATQALLRAWLDVFETPHLVNDEPSVIPNLIPFFDHRHDQAVWSVLRKRHPGAIILPDPQYSHDSPLQSRHLAPADE